MVRPAWPGHGQRPASVRGALGNDDVTHYRRVVRSLGETQRLMREIDEAIGDFPLP